MLRASVNVQRRGRAVTSLGQGHLEFASDLLDELHETPASAGPAHTEDSAQASIDALLSSTDRYASGKSYRELLRFVGALPSYKPFNRMLVHLQDPGAVYVATAARWRNVFGRGIKPNAQPLVVLQPQGPVMIVFDVHHTEPVVEDPRPVPASATDPLAISYRSLDEGIERRIRVATNNAVRDGIRITFVDQGGHSGGSTKLRRDSGIAIRRPLARPGKKTEPQEEVYPLLYDVIVNSTLDRQDQYATLVHELAHIYCGRLGSPNVDYWPDRKDSSHEVA